MVLPASPPSNVLVGRAPTLGFLPSGNYWAPPHGATTSNTRGNGNEFLIPMWIAKPISVASLIFETTVAGSAGAATRLGIHQCDTNLLPGAVLLDAGTVDSTVTPAVLELALAAPLVLTPGKYWLATVLQGTPATQPTYRVTSAATSYDISGSSASAVMLGSVCGYQKSGVTGALADLTGATLSATGTCIVVGIKGA